MPTIIDELIVSLSLDPTKFKKGEKEAVDSLRKIEEGASRSGKNTRKSVDEATEGFKHLQGRLLGVAGLLLGGLGIEQFIQKITRLNVATSNLSTVLGVSTGDLNAWAMAGQRVGVSGDAVRQGFAAIQAQRFNLQNYGESSQLLNLGYATRNTANPLTLQRPNGQMLPPDEFAKNIAKWLEKAPASERPAMGNALERAGLPRDFVAMLMQGSDKLNKLLAEAKKVAPTDQEIAALKKLNEAVEEMSQRAEAAGRKIAVELVPALVSMAKIAGEVADFIAHPFGRKEEDIVKDLERNRPGGAKYLEEEIRRKTQQLQTIDEQYLAAKGIYRKPLEDEQKRLTDELKKLREELQKANSGGGLQKSGFFGPSSSGGVMNASLGGGGFGGGTTYTDRQGRSYQGGAGGGGDGGSPMGGAGPDGPSGPLPIVPGGVINRSRFAEELKQKPWLRDKIMRIAANEQGRNALGTQAIIESMMNRAEARGTNLEKQARWYRSEGGYYDEGSMGRGALENSKSREVLEHALKGALGGSNVSEYATDNSSGGLAARERASGKFNFHKMINGESFFSPGWGGGRSGPGSRAAYSRWRNRIADEARKRGEGSYGGINFPADDIFGGTAPGGGKQSGLIDRAQFGALAGGDKFHSSTSSMTIGDIHMHTAATDGQGVLKDFHKGLRRFAHVQSANYGPA